MGRDEQELLLSMNQRVFESWQAVAGREHETTGYK